MSKIYYGLQDQEQLDNDPQTVVDGILEDACEGIGESFDTIADRIEWPIKVLEYKPLTLSESYVVDMTLDHVLETLDEEYANPDGDGTNPTDDMRTAANRLAKIIIRDYDVWTCEPTGDVLKYTREEVKRGQL